MELCNLLTSLLLGVTWQLQDDLTSWEKYVQASCDSCNRYHPVEKARTPQLLFTVELTWRMLVLYVLTIGRAHPFLR
ncbi:hypothetical protein AAZX31_13G141100 [Glycine max]|nr:hypothetical protein GLYMA_13G156102v4 [Glycine max]KAH1101732.1 hypothetical protein GYH30_036349 [Glycine max]